MKNGKRSDIEQRFYDLCLPAVSAEGLSVYDVEYLSGQHILRLFIMNSDTRTALIQDCARVDRALTPLFDAADWVPESLTLEVSSPGMTRQLRYPDHFSMAHGEPVSVMTHEKLTTERFDGLPKSLVGQKRVDGVLRESDENGIVIDANGYVLTLRFTDIKKANLNPDF